MSVIVSWIAPDQILPIGEQNTVTKVLINRSPLPGGPFANIATIDAFDATNQAVTMYEDLDGNLDMWYTIQFQNTNGDVSLPTVPGQAGYLDKKYEMLQDVRYRLFDFDPTQYRLDDERFIWVTAQLGSFLQQALNRVNQTPPRLTQLRFEDQVLPTELVKDWAVFYALKSRAILENFNAFQFSDGVSLTYERASKLFQASDGTFGNLDTSTQKWKRAYRPRAIGLGTSRLPFRVLRPLSFLPNMKNVFGI